MNYNPVPRTTEKLSWVNHKRFLIEDERDDIAGDIRKGVKDFNKGVRATMIFMQQDLQQAGTEHLTKVNQT